MLIDEIEKACGIPLPESYKQLVRSIPDFEYIRFNEFPSEFPDDEGVSWFFWGEKRLLIPAKIDGARTRPAWCQLASFAEIDKQRSMRRSIQSNQNPSVHAHLEKAFCIAEDNGDTLYLDPLDGHTVWVYMHDSGEVKCIASSFDDWLSRAIRDDS